MGDIAAKKTAIAKRIEELKLKEVAVAAKRAALEAKLKTL